MSVLTGVVISTNGGEIGEIIEPAIDRNDRIVFIVNFGDYTAVLDTHDFIYVGIL